MNSNLRLDTSSNNAEKIHKYHDERLEKTVVKIMPGGFYVAEPGELIMTVLGSCVSACIRERDLGIGGMNHFMLPLKGNVYNENPNIIDDASRFGNWAMEFLINNILKMGGKRRNLEIKIFGGARVLQLTNEDRVGDKNISFVLQYIHDENLALAVKDVGGDFPRKILYDPTTGKVKRKALEKHSNIDIVTKREKKYYERLVGDNSVLTKPDDIELF